MFVLACLIVALLIWFENTFYDSELLNPLVRYTVGTLTIFVGMVIWLGAEHWKILLGLLAMDAVAGIATLAPRIWMRILNKIATRGLYDGGTDKRRGLEKLYLRCYAAVREFFAK